MRNYGANSFQIVSLKMSILMCFVLLVSLLRHTCKTVNRRSFESLARLAFEHGVLVSERAACREPKPQLIYFSDPSKVYLPRATLLHRCSDLTGCCPHSTQMCQPLETQSVDLYFYTIAMKSSGPINSRHVSQYQNIDRIALTNHTRCGCRTRPGFDIDNEIFDDQPIGTPDVQHLSRDYRNASL